MSGGDAEGFSLVEVIVALVIGAIIFAIAGIGIVNVTNGMLLAKQNAATALKAQAALMRLDKELHIITAVSSGSATQLNYSRLNPDSSPASHTLSLSGTTILLDGDILVDNVASLTLTYADTYNGTFTSTWGSTNKVINLSFNMSGSGGTQSTFTMLVRAVNI